MVIPSGIALYKEIRTLSGTYICDILLENGVVIHLRDDGSAPGSDNRIYYSVSCDDENGDCKILGYSPDISSPIDNFGEKPPQVRLNPFLFFTWPNYY